MAKKRSTKKRGSKTDAVETTLIMPPGDLLKSLSKAKAAARKQMRSAGDVFSKKFSKAQDEKHVDRRAANIAFNLDSLDDETLHVTYFHLIRYMEDLGIPARATAQEEMFEAKETGPGVKNGKDVDEDGEASNVTHIGTAARKVAEQAGAEAG